MNHDQAKSLIKETFENPFDKNRFTYFGKNLLNKIEESPFTYPTQYIKDSFKPYINSMERIGKYSDGSADLDILIVKLQKETTLERARTAQRNYIASYLNGSRGGQLKDAALVAYVSPEEEDWRFSLVKMDYRFEQTPSGKMKVKEEFTPARRWSFLVGANEKSHTAQSRFIPFLTEDSKKPQLDELAGAFNIETVTKEFFEKYRNLFVTIKLCLDAIISKDPGVKADFKAKGIDTVNFSKKLMGQIVFLYFLQKKGWFGVGKDKAWGTGSRNFLRDLLDKKHGNYRNFFNDMLEPLFYEALRTDRSDDKGYYRKFDCKIPFLNGGLFDPIGNYDWKKTEVILPNELFSNDNRTKEGDTGDGIFDIFDRFNFTVREDEPLDKEVAIDPELLGKAYEKFNAIRPDNFGEYMKVLGTGQENKFNKEFGVYYTPREIVHYMCQKSLEYYLKEEFREKVQESDMEDFVTKAETVLENELVYQKKLKQIEAGQQKSTEYAPELPASILTNLEPIDKKLEEIKICDPAVGSGAFPVGLMNEIVRLRSAIHILSTGTIPPLYDIKRNCIERSIYGVDIDEGAIEIARLRLWLSLVVDEDDIRNIKPLPNLDYKLVRGNSLLGVEKNIHTKPMLDELEELKKKHFNETDPEKKKKEAAKITELISEITDGHKEFDFEIYFSEVFKEKKGFDVVIGNPPYVEFKKLKSSFKDIFNKSYKSARGKYDIYVLFIELSHRLLRNLGQMIFINPTTFLKKDYGKALRDFIRHNYAILQILDFADLQIFEGVTNYTGLFFFRKDSNQCFEFGYHKFKNSNDALADISLSTSFRGDTSSNIKDVIQVPSINLKENHWDFHVESTGILLDKLRLGSNELVEKVEAIFQGIASGKDEVFYVTDTTIKEYGLENEILFPLLKGQNVKRYSLNWSGYYVIYPYDKSSVVIPESRLKSNYPSVYRYLVKQKLMLEGREYFDNSSKKWYELWNQRKYTNFMKTRIVTPEISDRNNFVITDSFFGNTKTYHILLKEHDAGTYNFFLGLLNSRLLEYFYQSITSPHAGGFYAYKTQFLERIPVRDCPPHLRTPIITLVDKILSSKKRNPAANTSNLEAQIDQMVYKLYDLTDEEIEIVAKETKGKKA